MLDNTYMLLSQPSRHSSINKRRDNFAFMRSATVLIQTAARLGESDVFLPPTD